MVAVRFPDPEHRKALTDHLDAHGVEYLILGNVIGLSVFMKNGKVASKFAGDFVRERSLAWERVYETIDWRSAELKNGSLDAPSEDQKESEGKSNAE